MTVLAWAAGLAVVVALIALDRLAASVVRVEPRPPERGVAESGLAHEALRIPSGGEELHAWLLSRGGAVAPGDGAERPVVVLLHGWGASHGTVLPLAEALVAAGYDVLVFDARGHGSNRRVRHVTVRHLRDDVSAVVRHLRARLPNRRVVVAGHSMGGAACALAAAEGADVSGLVLIAAPADILEITAEHLSAGGLPGRPLVVLLLPFWWVRARSTFRRLSPHRRIGESDVPVLILQPEEDRRVARGHAERLARAAGRPLRIVAGAGHTDVLSNPEAHRWVLSFLEALEEG